MKVSYFIIVAICIDLMGCYNSSKSRKEIVVDSTFFYSEVIERIVTDNFLGHCIASDGLAMKLEGDFLQGKIDTASYVTLLDSLKSVIKRTSGSCSLEYHDQFQILSKADLQNGELEDALIRALSNIPSDSWLPEISVDSITTMMMKPKKLNLHEIAVNFLTLRPYKGLRNRPYGEAGIGVLSVSEACFNESNNRAILYYEFNCGPTCGEGEIILVERVSTKWRIVRSINVWNS